MSEHDYRFRILLPADWRVVDLGQLRQTVKLAQEEAMGVALDQANLIADSLSTDPDMAAVLEIPFQADGGRPAGVLLAAMVAYIFDAEGIPADLSGALGRRIVEGIEFEEGHPRSFLVHTSAIRSSDDQKVAVITFSSPNVEAADDLAPGFARLAEGASVQAAA